MSKDIKDIKSEIANVILNESDKKSEREKVIEEVDRVIRKLYQYIKECITSDMKLYCGECRNLLKVKNNIICEKCGFDNTKIIKEYKEENWNVLVNKTAKLLNTTPEKAIVFLKKQLEKIFKAGQKSGLW